MIDGKIGFVSKPTKHWTREGSKNLRLFMEKFAKARNFDPLLASSWYSISGKEFEHTEVIWGNTVCLNCYLNLCF